MRAADFADAPCSIARPAALLGDVWTLLVLRQAFLGQRRFDELQSALDVSRALLADRLHSLVEAGILRREPYKDGGRTREQYRLTDKGLDLFPVLMAMRTWADRHQSPDGPFVMHRHDACGGLTEVVHRCTGCGEELTARDVRPEPGPGLLALSASA